MMANVYKSAALCK